MQINDRFLLLLAIIKDKKRRLSDPHDDCEEARKNRRLLFESYKDILKLSINEVLALGGPDDLSAFDNLHAAITDFFLPDSSSPQRSKKKQRRPKQLSHGSMPTSPSHHNLLEDVSPIDIEPDLCEHSMPTAAIERHFFGSLSSPDQDISPVLPPFDTRSLIKSIVIQNDFAEEPQPQVATSDSAKKSKTAASYQKPPTKKSSQSKPSRKLRNPQKRFAQVVAG